MTDVMIYAAGVVTPMIVRLSAQALRAWRNRRALPPVYCYQCGKRTSRFWGSKWYHHQTGEVAYTHTHFETCSKPQGFNRLHPEEIIRRELNKGRTYYDSRA